MNQNSENSLAGGDVSNEQRNQMPPGLRFHDQTPIPTNTSKRLCSQLSPLDEQDDSLASRIDAMIAKSFEAYLPKYMDEIKASIETTVKSLVEEHIKGLKEDIFSEMQFQYRQTELKTKCEAETLETYNRRENLRILGIKSSQTYEDNDTTAEKVVEVAKLIGANVSSTDISIAHRLPSRKQDEKPIIVRFARRIARLNILRNKKKLKETNASNIRVFEDLTTARLRFFNIMKADMRISKVWTREGTIFFVWKEDSKTYTIQNLFDGGLFLNYEMSDIEDCFMLSRE